MIEFTEVRPELIASLAARLPPEQALELQRGGWVNAEHAITDSIEVSHEVFMAHWDGDVQAVFGVSEWHGEKPPGMPRTAVPWVLGTHPRKGLVRQFLRLSRDVLARWNETFPILTNQVDGDNVVSQRWLIHMGLNPFAVQDINGFPFIEFGVINPCALPR